MAARLEAKSGSRTGSTWLPVCHVVLMVLFVCVDCQAESISHDQAPSGHLDGALPASTAAIFLFFATGFLTGLSHCLGMCGPLVSVFSMQQRVAGRAVATPLVLYQAGRLSTYTLLGALMGGIGSAFQMVALRQGWQAGLSVFVGLMMLTVGLSLMAILPGLRLLESATLAGKVSGWIRAMLAAKHPMAPFGMGMANGLLPCGPVYAMALVGAAAGKPLHGAMVMLLFGLGTLPSMLGVGLLTAHLSARLRRHLFRLAAVLIALVGVQLVLRGLALGDLVSHVRVAGVMLW